MFVLRNIEENIIFRSKESINGKQLIKNTGNVKYNVDQKRSCFFNHIKNQKLNLKIYYYRENQYHKIAAPDIFFNLSGIS